MSENAPLMDRTSAAELDGVHSNAGWSWRGRLLRRKVVRAGRVVVQVERGEAGRQLEKAERQGWGAAEREAKGGERDADRRMATPRRGEDKDAPGCGCTGRAFWVAAGPKATGERKTQTRGGAKGGKWS